MGILSNYKILSRRISKRSPAFLLKKRVFFRDGDGLQLAGCAVGIDEKQFVFLLLVDQNGGVIM